MAISQRVYVTNMTSGMFSGAFSLCWLRARARGISLPLSLLHISRVSHEHFLERCYVSLNVLYYYDC
jgi:hypothetical protein